MTDATQTWYLTSALLVGPDGRHQSAVGLSPASDERSARLGFAEHLLDTAGQQGMAVREVTATSLARLSISVKAPEADAGEAET